MVGIACDAAEQHIVGSEIEAVELKRAVAGHEWIVFVAQTQRGSELISDPVAIADKQAVLPFPSGRFDELFALAHAEAVSCAYAKLSSESQLELCKRIELVGRSSAV